MELYIVVWHEAIEPSDLITGVFTDFDTAEKVRQELCDSSSGDYWEIVTKQLNKV